MEFFIVFILIGAVLVVGVVIYFAIYQQRQHTAEKKDAAQAAGFSAPAGSLETLNRRILHLHQGPGRRSLKVSQVWHRSFPDGEIILFDLEDTGGDTGTQIGDQDVLLISRYLNLPRFTLTPRPRLPQEVSGLRTRLADWAASLGAGQHMDSLGHPAFDARFWVSAPDPDAARAYLTPDRLERLARLAPVRVEAGGDMLSLIQVAYAQYQPDGQKDPPLSLNQKTQQAMQLFQILAEPVAAPRADPAGINAAPAAAASAALRAKTSAPVCPQCGAPQTIAAGQSGEMACPYCGAAVYVRPLEPLVPTGQAAVVENLIERLNDESWQRQVLSAPVMGKMRKAEAIGCTLPFAIVWTLFACFFLVMVGGITLRDWREYQLLLNEGVSVSATVTGLVADRDSDGDTSYDVYYTYRVKSETLVGKETVSQAVFNSLREGQSVRILYAASLPETSALAESFAPPSLLAPLFGGCMSLGFVGIGIGLVIKTFRDIKKKY